MAIPARQASSSAPRRGVEPDGLASVMRIVAVLLLLLLPIGAWFVIGNITREGPAPQAGDLSALNPGSVFSDTTTHFLPTPVAALPAEDSAAPPAAQEQTVAQAQAVVAADVPVERVKIANTGGAGAILRAQPPKGPQVAGLRDGTVLQVLEHRQVDDAEWLRVQTPGGVEGWVFARLVAPSD